MTTIYLPRQIKLIDKWAITIRTPWGDIVRLYSNKSSSTRGFKRLCAKYPRARATNHYEELNHA